MSPRPYDDAPERSVDLDARHRAGSEPGRRRWLLAVAGSLLLVAGAVAGGAVVTVTGISSDTRVEMVPSPYPSPVSAASSSPPTTAVVRLRPQCLQALDQAQSAYDVLQQMGHAGASLDFAGLDRLVRRLQAMRDALGRNIAQCHATVELPPSARPTPAGH